MAARTRLVELKARLEDFARARTILGRAEHVGTYRQTDTYFALGERRLKLREVDGRETGELICYERPDLAGVKESEVLLLQVGDPATLKEMLARILGVQVLVRKRRDVYRLDGAQVHLDEVDGLGRFLEFELAVQDSPKSVEDGRTRLAALRSEFSIPEEDLVASSYSDLLAE